MAQYIVNNSPVILAQLKGYVDAKIEECRTREPLPIQISAWQEMKMYIETIEGKCVFDVSPWKPSEEQMKGFKQQFGNFAGYPIMESLYNDLLKLM